MPERLPVRTAESRWIWNCISIQRPGITYRSYKLLRWLASLVYIPIARICVPGFLLAWVERQTEADTLILSFHLPMILIFFRFHYRRPFMKTIQNMPDDRLSSSTENDLTAGAFFTRCWDAWYAERTATDQTSPLRRYFQSWYKQNFRILLVSLSATWA